ncbi:hypothetical protein OTU49_001793 [Cherax quadricarinatus]|uniref:Uncharacterized protein n=1 Tax=Cherax quadricarinatus TaxID=27406 RepID=A0AAW0XSY0_CHEQU|nr:cytochrome c oxidase assembly factor 8-like isoform X2 [Cherax quadricarinatus]
MLGLHARNCSLMLERHSVEILPICGFASESTSSASVIRDRKSKKSKEVKCDCIGPPDPESNLRITKFYIPPNETPLERQYRDARFETQEWNQTFWKDHNTKFKKLKEEFIRVRLREKYGNDTKDRKSLSADEMSEFYKKFLDDHQEVHKEYNREWYKKNANNLLLATRVYFQQRGNKQR